MTEHVQQMLSLMRSREYRSQRCNDEWDITNRLAGKDAYESSTEYLRAFLERECPVIYDGDIFGFNRHMAKYPTAFTDDGNKFYIRFSNVIPNYMLLINRGIDSVLTQIEEALPHAEGHSRSFYTAAKEQLHLLLRHCDAYREHAKAIGSKRLYNALCRIPRQPAADLYEACLFQRILVYFLRCARHSHLPYGRFDQYMYPYYEKELKNGKTKEQIKELLQLYFIAMNFDSDIYLGMQQGDNGQSMVLGGYDLDGTNRFNDFSMLCFEASEELSLIDPKINLRVSSKTPPEIYAMGTRMTKKGLGFPQYCNDDVIIPGLIKLGYCPEDAANYAVAACWEPIIPGCGADISNCTIFSFPEIVCRAIHKHLLACSDFEALMSAVTAEFTAEAENIIVRYQGPDHYYFARPIPVSPLLSLIMEGCLEKGLDVSRFSSVYYNSGCQGAGISTAADSLAAVKKLVFDEKTVTCEELLTALKENFEGHTELRSRLSQCPKMGNDDDYVDSIAARLMEMFSSALNGKPNSNGGVWRASTGSAQNYIHKATECPATPDGRRSAEPFACSFSPAPNARMNGPLSAIRSFTKPPLTDLIGGGPMTMELHHNVFRNAEGESKVAQLVQLFVLSGGHQLQLNTVNRQQLLNARKNPDAYPNLIVRVWGWSGYFRELDPEFQDHIINRTQYSF